MDNLVKTGKGILYHIKQSRTFTLEDLNEAVKTIFGYE